MPRVCEAALYRWPGPWRVKLIRGCITQIYANIPVATLLKIGRSVEIMGQLGSKYPHLTDRIGGRLYDVTDTRYLRY